MSTFLVLHGATLKCGTNLLLMLFCCLEAPSPGSIRERCPVPTAEHLGTHVRTQLWLKSIHALFLLLGLNFFLWKKKKQGRGVRTIFLQSHLDLFLHKCKNESLSYCCEILVYGNKDVGVLYLQGTLNLSTDIQEISKNYDLSFKWIIFSFLKTRTLTEL